MSDWFSILNKAKKSCIEDGNLKKIHYQLENGQELVEEYNTDTDTLTRRAWKRQKKFAGEGDWEVEIGDPEPTVCIGDTIADIRENQSQPCISRRNTKKILEWRIRNLPYPPDVYSVTADNEQRCIYVKTSNKKYFKILKVPELDRLNLPLEEKNLTFLHKFKTLIITYQKPPQLVDLENKVLNEVRKLKPKDFGDVNNCKPS